MRKVLYILGKLNDHDIDWMVKFGKKKRFGTGEVLISEGVQSNDLFIVLEGHCQISIQGGGRITDLGIGEIIGEMSFVDSMPPSATVTASEPVLMLAIDKGVMADELRSNVEFSSRFYQALAIFLAARLRATQQHRVLGEDGELNGEEMLEDELDINVLDSVSQAGENFTRLIRRLSGG